MNVGGRKIQLSFTKSQIWWNSDSLYASNCLLKIKYKIKLLISAVSFIIRMWSFMLVIVFLRRNFSF
jgi:hypothetical protein